MTSARDIILRPIDPKTSRAFIERHHYSGKTTPNTQFHIGVFLGNSLEGVLQYGPSLDRKRMLGLVTGTGLRQCIELNRMAFTDRLPRNSESRALAISFRLLKKHAPHIKWVISFADATQCGDGTIYRAAGFLLTGIKENTNLLRLPSGEVIHKMKLENSPNAPREELAGRSYFDATGGTFALKSYCQASGAVPVPGYQIRYIKFLDDTWRDRLTCDVLPYSALDDAGARMYRGHKLDTQHPADEASTEMRPEHHSGRGRFDSDPSASHEARAHGTP